MGRTWQAFLTFLASGIFKANPQVSATFSIPYSRYFTNEGFDANPKSMSASCARTRPKGNFRSVFCPFMNTAMSTVNMQAAQRLKTTAQQHHQQVAPRVCGTSICAVLLWLVVVVFSGSASYLQSTTCLLLLLWTASPLWTKILGLFGFKTLASMVLITSYLRSSICVPPPPRAHPAMCRQQQ